MSRTIYRSLQIVVDLAALSAAYWLAFLLRFEGDLPFRTTKLILFTWPYVILLQYAVLAIQGVPNFAWRYIGLAEAKTILGGISISVAILLAIRLGAQFVDVGGYYTRYVRVPMGVLATDLPLAFLAVTGSRSLRRIQTEAAERKKRGNTAQDRVRTLLVGAGRAGVLVAREIHGRPDLDIEPVAFVDDDPLKVGTMAQGLRVLGTTKEIARLASAHHVKQALITISNAPGSDIRRVTRACQEAGLATKLIPGMYEIVGGQVNLSRIRPVAIEDLLRREPVSLDEDDICRFIEGRSVLVTGAGGSIGSELCLQIARYGPQRLVLFERSENALFEVHRTLVAQKLSGVDLVPCVGDVTDAARVAQIFDEHEPCVVFHAAAHKHVPMMEWNVGEAVKNNVLGTRTIAAAADRSGAEAFIMVSTDKAVNPTSVMGATKRVAELFVQALSQHSKTRFVTVRFGNVLGSAGSVIPIFKQQIASGGPVTVTHPDMKRYFMTIPEACQLVLQSATMGRGGEIFILDMGEPVRIMDLATDLIRLSGMTPGEDIEIQVTGMRPGEKLLEELSNVDEEADKTRHPLIYVGRTRPRDHKTVDAAVEALGRLAQENQSTALRQRLSELLPDSSLSAGQHERSFDETALPASATTTAA